MEKFKGTKNWRIRTLSDGMFFIEGDLPNPGDHHPRTEVMCEDFGDHNGYTREMRMADAQLISKAPEMYDILFRLSVYEHVDFEEIQKLVKQATEV